VIHPSYFQAFAQDKGKHVKIDTFTRELRAVVLVSLPKLKTNTMSIIIFLMDKK
jgi:hypothetical protein